MKRKWMVLAALMTMACVCAGAKGLQMKDLPGVVQKTVQANLKGGEIKSISKEKENGVTQYEVETMVGGKHRDFDVDAAGKLLVVEEEVAIGSLPAAAKAAIEKRVAGGAIQTVELVTKADGTTAFEAAFKTKAGKKGSVVVKADGTETKE